ncbi:pantoate--beta-alanine ligase [Cellulosilyticum sp. I15G10I2]|uniref:pantoate--beta-alanine ligase n=1 Tax=Cellulosilyticum sp. I15G10I2 TaxID=1892843 RepID=UPI00085C5CC2|nr:pantoate--beta-alanine ligase [Cellulosilyticum sp. I15G10I2]
MSIIQTVQALNIWLDNHERSRKSLGFVPTMGYLHEGHLSLIREAKANNDLVIVSIFVNPTQFAPGEDFDKYPRNLERDYELSRAAGADVVFHPEVDEVYPDGAATQVEVTGALTQTLCGLSRPTHFKGVTTVVNILLNMVRPNQVYFGQKDAQQALIIKKMIRDLYMQVKLNICPIVREADGLAMSSRNVYLNPEERRQALILYRSIQKGEELVHQGVTDVREVIQAVQEEITKAPLAVIDYIEILEAKTLESIDTINDEVLLAVAVKFGKTRLIDNKLIKPQEGQLCF